MDPLTLVLANVGLSIFNNWRNNKQNRKLQEKQQQFARAAAERNKQRMWQLMQEGQELALEMEREMHKDRMEDIKNDFDKILHRLAYAEAIKTWPLKVLPIVMKNQSLGNLLAASDENIAMHCILTPSNCSSFNAQALPLIEEKLADFCNLHWSSLSSHPILFYSGAWKSGTIPSGIEIDLLKTNLRNLPTLLITPFFKSNGGVVFQLNVWGISVELQTEIECQDFSYADSYKAGVNYKDNGDLKNCTIEEFVPYLQCLVGYIADQYFWMTHNEAPLLPTLLALNVVNTDGMRYLNTATEERYSTLLDVCETESQSMPFASKKILTLLEGSIMLLSEKDRIKKLESIFITYCSNRCEKHFVDIDDAIQNYPFSINDISFLKIYLSFKEIKNRSFLEQRLSCLNNINLNYSILDNCDTNSLVELINSDNSIAFYRLGEIYQYSIEVKANLAFAEECFENSIKLGFPLAIYKGKLLHGLPFTNEEIDIIEILHNSGVQQATFILAEIKSKGLGCQKSTDVACDILNCVKKSKHPYYYYLAAMVLMDGYGSEEKEAIYKLLKTSADMGYLKAIEKLMMVYTVNELVKADPKRHLEYAQRAAEQGSLLGITRLGYCYAMGYGTEKSLDKAKNILSIAAKRDYQDAIKLLNILNQTEK